MLLWSISSVVRRGGAIENSCNLSNFVICDFNLLLSRKESKNRVSTVSIGKMEKKENHSINLKSTARAFEKKSNYTRMLIEDTMQTIKKSRIMVNEVRVSFYLIS